MSVGGGGGGLLRCGGEGCWGWGAVQVGRGGVLGGGGGGAFGCFVFLSTPNWHTGLTLADDVVAGGAGGGFSLLL